MNKLLVILGPTATGKTDLALKMAKIFSGELVACDSRQVYKGLDIGTGKDGAKAWMYDVVGLRKQFTVFDYVKEANKVIGNILKRGRLPIVVGGTGFYLKALLEGLPGLNVPIDISLRKKLEKLSLLNLQQKLQEIYPQKWVIMNNSDRYNSRRLVRAIELKVVKPKKVLQTNRSNFNVFKIGLFSPRNILYEKINKKVLEWIERGIIKEVEDLINNGINKDRIMNLGLEYRVIIEFLDNKISKELMIRKMRDKVRAYARRQITWFKREKNVSWFDITEKNFPEKLEKEAVKWYYQKYAAKG